MRPQGHVRFSRSLTKILNGSWAITVLRFSLSTSTLEGQLSCPLGILLFVTPRKENISQWAVEILDKFVPHLDQMPSAARRQDVVC